MKGKTLDKNHIEMRSEKVRKIVSTNPPMFISWGIIIIMLVFMILFVIVLNLSYPYEGKLYFNISGAVICTVSRTLCPLGLDLR